MSHAQLFNSLFEGQATQVLRNYSALNPGLERIVKAGTLIVLGDPNNTSCTYEQSQLMQAAQEVKAALEPLTPEEADFMMKHAHEIATFTGQTSTWLGVSAVVLEKHLTGLRDTLVSIERLHQDSFKKFGHLNSPEFFAERRRLMSQVDAHLPGYAKHVKVMSRAAKYMQAGGYIGIGLGGLSSLVAIQEVCNAGTEEACRKARYTEGGTFALSAGFGYYGGEIGYTASGPICLALGVSTGIGGVVCVAAVVGAGSWLGTTGGGMAGEWLGEFIYKRTQP